MTNAKVSQESGPAANPSVEGEPLWYEIVRDGARVCTVDREPDANFLFSAIEESERPWKKLVMTETVDRMGEILEVRVREETR